MKMNYIFSTGKDHETFGKVVEPFVLCIEIWRLYSVETQAVVQTSIVLQLLCRFIFQCDLE
jgi:hypothetical protein